MSNEVFHTRDCSLNVFSIDKTICFEKFDKLIFVKVMTLELIFLFGDVVLLQFVFG